MIKSTRQKSCARCSLQKLRLVGFKRSKGKGRAVVDHFRCYDKMLYNWNQNSIYLESSIVEFRMEPCLASFLCSLRSLPSLRCDRFRPVCGRCSRLGVPCDFSTRPLKKNIEEEVNDVIGKFVAEEEREVVEVEVGYGVVPERAVVETVRKGSESARWDARLQQQQQQQTGNSQYQSFDWAAPSNSTSYTYGHAAPPRFTPIPSLFNGTSNQSWGLPGSYWNNASQFSDSFGGNGFQTTPSLHSPMAASFQYNNGQQEASQWTWILSQGPTMSSMFSAAGLFKPNQDARERGYIVEEKRKAFAGLEGLLEASVREKVVDAVERLVLRYHYHRSDELPGHSSSSSFAEQLANLSCSSTPFVPRPLSSFNPSWPLPFLKLRVLDALQVLGRILGPWSCRACGETAVFTGFQTDRRHRCSGRCCGGLWPVLGLLGPNKRSVIIPNSMGRSIRAIVERARSVLVGALYGAMAEIDSASRVSLYGDSADRARLLLQSARHNNICFAEYGTRDTLF